MSLVLPGDESKLVRITKQAVVSGLPESRRRADIGRLSERAIPVIAAHHPRSGTFWKIFPIFGRDFIPAA
jgi:hypothetical protein